MFAPGTTLYLSIPCPFGRRILHPGKVVECAGDGVVAQFEETLDVGAGADVNLYCEVDGRFWQRGAAVVEVLRADSGSVLSLRFTSQMVSAESRGSHRVSLAATPLPATVDGRTDCAVVDVSPEGFAVITSGQLRQGAMVDVTFTYRGITVAGRARIQAVRQRPDGKHRYGFLTLDNDRDVRRSLERITAMVQREQLQRMARTA